MPLKDTLKGLRREFDSVRQDLSKIISPGQGQSQGHQQYGYGQQQGGYPSQQGHGQPQQQYGSYSVNPPQQGYQPPNQSQYHQSGQPPYQPQNQQYQNPGQPPQPQWQSGTYGQQHNQQYPLQQGQQQQFPPQPGQQQQPYGQPAQQHPGSPPPPPYNSLPPGQQPGSPPPQHGFSAPAVPYGSHPGSPQPPQAYQQQYGQPPQTHSPQPPQAHFQQQQYGAAPQSQHPMNQPGIFWKANFDSSQPVSAEWEHKLGNNNGWGNAELQNYTNDQNNSFYTNDRKLVLRAVSRGGQYTSARLVSKQKLAKPRGCLTTWLTSPCAGGIWPAFWLLPAEPFSWPNDGEVDIAETWNGDLQNHTCLHWGYYTPQDAWKHRVIGTNIPDMAQRAVKFEFAWDQNEANGQGRLLWWIDGRPVMKAPIPDGTRRMRDFQVIINIAMGGNVCQGRRPRDGSYDFVVHEVNMRDEPEGGWARFEQSWQQSREGNTM